MTNTEFNQSVQNDIDRMMEPKTEPMLYAFECFFKGKQTTIMAQSTYQAQQCAAIYFKAKKAYEISVMRAEIVHCASIL